MIILFFFPSLVFNYDGSEIVKTNDTNRAKFDSLIKIADSKIWKFDGSYYDTNNIRDAILTYKQALLVCPNNDETILKLAIIYDTVDSVNLAKKYYESISKKFIELTNTYNQIKYPEIEVDKLKNNFYYTDSLEVLFKKFGEESSITFDYDISYSVSLPYIIDYIALLFKKEVFITIYGNGKFEARKYDSLKKSKIYFEGKMPDSTLSIILKTLQNGRFLSMKSLFYKEKKDINRYLGPYANNLVLITHNMDRSIYERIKIETPLVSNSVNIMYLIGCDELSVDINLFKKGCCDDIKLIYDNTKGIETEAKIRLLEELWKYIYCLDLTKYSND